MKIEIKIIGAGLAGVAAAWHLLQKRGVTVTLYDPNGIGGTASILETALMHPFAGIKCQLNPYGHEGMRASLALLKIA